jgi:hypothetical protein
VWPDRASGRSEPGSAPKALRDSRRAFCFFRPRRAGEVRRGSTQETDWSFGRPSVRRTASNLFGVRPYQSCQGSIWGRGIFGSQIRPPPFLEPQASAAKCRWPANRWRYGQSAVSGIAPQPPAIRPAAGLRNLLRKERAPMKRRTGNKEGRARAHHRASTSPRAATHRHACPARQSAEGPITPALSGERANPSERTPEGTRHAGCTRS